MLHLHKEVSADSTNSRSLAVCTVKVLGIEILTLPVGGEVPGLTV